MQMIEGTPQSETQVVVLTSPVAQNAAACDADITCRYMLGFFFSCLCAYLLNGGFDMCKVRPEALLTGLLAPNC